MKKLCLALMSLLLVPSVASAIVLNNPSFEGGSGIPGWSGYQLVAPIATSTINHSGGNSANPVLAAGKVFGFLNQDIGPQITPGTAINVEGWLKAVGSWNTKTFVRVEFMKDDWSSTGAPLESSGVANNEGWVKQSVSSIIPPLTTKVVVGYGLYNWTADPQVGNVYVDDMSVNGSPIPEPTSMLLLGSGLAGLIGFSRKK